MLDKSGLLPHDEQAQAFNRLVVETVNDAAPAPKRTRIPQDPHRTYTRRRLNPMAQQPNGNAQRKAPPVPLTLLDQGSEEEDGEEMFIVVGEAGDDIAFELCEDIDIAVGVRDAMQEDGFSVRIFQAQEIEIVEEDTPAPGPGRSA